MKIIQFDEDDKKFRRDIAHMVGASDELRSLGHKLEARAKANYARIKDTGHYASLVKLTREKSKSGRLVDYVVSVEAEGIASLEWGHWTGSRDTPKHLRRWVPGRFPMTNALPGQKKYVRKRLAKMKHKYAKPATPKPKSVFSTMKKRRRKRR